MKITVTLNYETEHREKLEKIAAGHDVIYEQKPSSELIGSSDIILGNVAPPLINGAEMLKWIHLNSAGVDAYLKDGVLSENTILTNANGAYGLAISEYMMAVMLSSVKKLPDYMRQQDKQIWNSLGEVKSVYNSTIVVIGLGDIGGEFAKRAKAFGAHLIGIKRTVGEKPEYVDELYSTDKLDEVLPKADVVALCLPNTPDTVNILDRNRLFSMKKGSLLINIGRGTAIDHTALGDALNSEHLSGACLDVTNPEPLPAEHPLWHAKNLILTPHVSGGWHLHATYEKAAEIGLHNLDAFLSGKPMKNVIDKKIGY